MVLAAFQDPQRRGRWGQGSAGPGEGKVLSEESLLGSSFCPSWLGSEAAGQPPALH